MKDNYGYVVDDRISARVEGWLDRLGFVKCDERMWRKGQGEVHWYIQWGGCDRRDGGKCLGGHLEMVIYRNSADLRKVEKSVRRYQDEGEKMHMFLWGCAMEMFTMGLISVKELTGTVGSRRNWK